MAEAKGIISLEVKGQSKLDRLISSVNQLDSIVQGLSKSPLEIDAKKAKSELDRLETDLKALRQNIQNSEKQIDRAGNSINEYAGEIVALQSKLKELNPNTVAYNKVLERQQKAINNLAQAQGNLAKAEQELESSQSKIGATTKSVETAKAAKRASEAINNLADDYLRLGRSQEKGISGVILKNQLNPTIAQLSAQADVLKLVASNSRIASSEFNRFTIASQAAGQKIFEANQKQLSAAAFGLSASAPAVNVGRAGVSSIAGARSQVASLIKLYPEIVKSEAALSSYAEQLRTLQSLVPYTSNEFRALEEAIAGVSQEISGIGSRGQTSAIRSALGPSTDLGSLKAFQQREKHEERVTAELIRQAGIEDRINRGNINQNQALELRNRLDEAASALAEGRLVTARRIAIETDKQRMSMERNLGGVSVIGALGTGFSPITGRMPSGEIIPGSPADKGRQAKARLGWQSALAQMSVVASELKNTAKTKGAKIQMDWNLAFEKAKDIISDATLAGLQKGTKAAVSLGQQQIREMERSTAKLWREFGGPALPPRMASEKMPTGGVLRSSELSPIDAPRRLRGALASGAILEQSLVNLQGKGADVTSQLISLQNTLNDAKREDYLISQKNLDALAEQISLTGKFITLQNKVLSGQSKQSKQSSFGVALSPQQIQQEIGKIVTDFNRVVPSAEKTGNNLVSTFSSSLKGGASSAAVAAKSFADVIKQAIEKAFGIASPSKFIQELVENLVSTFIVEIASAAPSVANAFNNTFGQRNLGPGYGDIGPGLPARSRAFGVGLAPSVFRRFGGQAQSSAAFSPIFQPGSTPPIGAPGSGFPYFPAYNLSTTKFPSSGPANILAKGNRSTDTSRVVLESIKQYRAAVNNFWEGEDSQFEAITRVLTSSADLGAARLARRLQQGPDLTQAERIVQEARGIAAGQKSGTLSRISDVITGEKRLGISSAIGNVSQRISDSLLDSLEILGFTITDGLRDAIDKVRNAVPSVLGGIAGILPPGGFGGGGRGGAAGAGGPQNVNDLERALGLGNLAPIARATGEQIEELAARLNELRQRIDPTTQDFRELTQQLGILSREAERRSPEADFLTRRVGPRAARGISEGVIGGAFPLLFGQGLGASIGGGVGGFAGGFAGGGLGFGLSLIGTALGTAFDTLSQAAQDTGKALRTTTEGFEKLKEAGLLANKQQENYIQKLIEAGKISEAQAIIQSEIVKKVGARGAEDLRRLGSSSEKLSKAWAEFNLQLQAALAGPLAGLLDWVTGIVAASNRRSAAASQIADIERGLSGAKQNEFLNRLNQISVVEGGIGQGILRDFGIGQSAKDIARMRADLINEYAPFANTKSSGVAMAAAELEAVKTAKAKTEELRAQVELARLQLTLAGQNAEVDARGFAQTSKRIALQEYENKLIQIKADWIGQVFDKEKNLLMIRQANLEYQTKLKEIDLQAQRNQESNEKERFGLLGQIAQVSIDEIEARMKLVELSRGESVATEERLKQTARIDKLAFAVLSAERQSALIGVKNVEQQRLINIFFEGRLGLLNAQRDAEVLQQQLLQKRIALESKLESQRRSAEMTDLKTGLSREQRDVEMNIAGFFQTDKEIAKARMLEQQQNRRYDRELEFRRQIQKLEAEIGAGAYVGTELENKQKDLNLSYEKLAVLQQELMVLDQLEQKQLNLQNIFGDYGQAIQTVSGEIGNLMTFSVKEIVSGTQTAQEVFANFLDAVANALLQTAAQMIATYVAIGIAKMFAGFGNSSGSLPGAAPQMTPGAVVTPTGFQGQFAGIAAKGAYFDGAISHFAKGGMFTNSIVSSPTLFRFADGAGFSAGLMGEAGPEAIMPLTRGPGGRLGVDASGSGESINVTVNVDASGSKVQGDDQSANQLGRVVANAVQQELIKQKRPGGLLS